MTPLNKTVRYYSQHHRIECNAILIHSPLYDNDNVAESDMISIHLKDLFRSVN